MVSLNFRIRHYRNKNGTEAEMRLAIVSRYASVSYWPIFSSSLITVPEVFATIISPQFFFRFYSDEFVNGLIKSTSSQRAEKNTILL